MATILSPSQHDDNIPTATLALPSIAISTATASRRLPPPCWSPEETVALIDAYKDKWYSLRRGNLRANHWKDVADDIASRCSASPPKTAVQCRHKMEKLRKRYRAEIQRAAAHGGVRRFTSSWPHFQNMHSMDKGTNNPTPPSSSDEEEEDDDKNIINGSYNQNGYFRNQMPVDNGATPGVRIKIPGRATVLPTAHRKFNSIAGQNPNNLNPRFTNPVPSSYGVAPRFISRVDEILKNKRRGVEGVVEAIQAIGEGFMRTEKVKMDMAREIEEMRMETELKRTEMILESQQRIVEAFANAISARSVKKSKRMQQDEC